ncbi:MAG TPA: NAD(P)-binding domain-containing protein [Saprospiraceae bacterium]|nr:NAD(P)-binding domain-containing protein [Saprospiraceae bacterium]HPN68828.1 NAD(P)-binding domain-containing protein [Saprospiraceae bacterium]
MEVLIEQWLIYGTVTIFCAITIYVYLKKQRKNSAKVVAKIIKAKEEGLYEPMSLHPYIDSTQCIGCGSCVTACPEKDILGLVDNKAEVINASNCVGHGACFHACPVEAISLRIGTESRGVELPHVNENIETNVKGIFLAGELGGMGLIKNSIEQGEQAVENIGRRKFPEMENVLDLAIVGAGPAGISGSLTAKKMGLSSVTLEQNSLGGTVYTFPRAKIVMTAPVNLPLFGKVKLFNTNKSELLDLWHKVIAENSLDIQEHTKVESIIPQSNGTFKTITSTGKEILSHSVLLAIGRRGSPRKLAVPGEETQKVAYRLLEPERIFDKKIIVVGGGDSAIESAMLLMDHNEVILSYRSDKFSRLKPKNRENIQLAAQEGKLKIWYNSNLLDISEKTITLQTEQSPEGEIIENDLVYIFAGGELPTPFLQKIGIEITKRFGHIMKKH